MAGGAPSGLYTVDEIASRLNLSTFTVRRMLDHDGNPPATASPPPEVVGAAWEGVTPADVPDWIWGHVSRVYAQPREAVLSTSRSQMAVKARLMVWVLLRDLGFSLPEIGRMTNRDHKTVLHGLRKAGYGADGGAS